MRSRMKLICGVIGVAKGFSFLPDGQCRYGRTEAHVSGLPAKAEGGNPGKYSSESPEGVEVRQDDPLMPKTDSITGYPGNEEETSRLADEVAKR